MLETLQALAAFAVAGLLMLAFLPLWPFGIWAMIEWQRAEIAPDLPLA